MIRKTKNETSNAIIMFHLYFCYYFPFYSVCDKSCTMIVFFVVTKNVSFTLPPKRNSFYILYCFFHLLFLSPLSAILFIELTFFPFFAFDVLSRSLLYSSYVYSFYFHPKIVSNRSVDHDPSEVPHILYNYKSRFNHMFNVLIH